MGAVVNLTTLPFTAGDAVDIFVLTAGYPKTTGALACIFLGIGKKFGIKKGVEL